MGCLGSLLLPCSIRPASNAFHVCLIVLTTRSLIWVIFSFLPCCYLAVEPHEGGPSNQLTGLADSCIWSSFSQSRPSRWACFPVEMPDHSCWDAGHFELYLLGPVKIPEPCSGTVIWKQFGAVRPGGLEQLPWPRQGPACPNTVGPEASVCTCLWVRPQPLCLSAWGVSFLL